MDSEGEGEGGKIWENSIETCKISCMKRDASPGSMHDTGCLGLVHWDSLAPHERLTDLAVVPREKPHTGAAAREQPRHSPVIER